MTRYWFSPKRYGYGATPVAREGWAVTFGAAAVVAGSVVAMNLLVEQSNVVAWLLWAVVIGGVTFWFVRPARDRTDGEWRWRWGNRAEPTETRSLDL
jgi:hypothetical protein